METGTCSLVSQKQQLPESSEWAMCYPWGKACAGRWRSQGLRQGRAGPRPWFLATRPDNQGRARASRLRRPWIQGRARASQFRRPGIQGRARASRLRRPWLQGRAGPLVLRGPALPGRARPWLWPRLRPIIFRLVLIWLPLLFYLVDI